MSNDPNPNEGPYHIIISEAQRALLVEVMKFALKDFQFCLELSRTVDEGSMMGRVFQSNQLAELKALLDMSEQLRGSEAGVIQGFCL